MISQIAVAISKTFFWSRTLIVTTALLTISAYFINHPSCVTPSQFAATFLKKKEYITDDIARFQFELPNNIEKYLNETPFPVYLTFVNNELNVTRHYTPITWDLEKRTMDFIIQRIPGGSTSNFLHRLKIGSPLRMSGPFSQWSIPTQYSKIGMIAGDSGITVFVQLLPHLLREGKEIKLLYYSTSGLHLLKNDLESIQNKYPDQFQIKYLKKEPLREHVEMHLPSPADNPLVMLCCPKHLMGAMAGYKDESSLLAQGKFSGYLKELLYEEKNVHKF